MKKLSLLFIMFLFINQVNAQTIEDQLVELKNNVNKLEEKMNDIEKNRLEKIYPIGSIYETTIYSTTTEVEAALGGKWERYGNGRTIVGVDESNDNFDTVNKTGGTADTLLNVENLPSHTHSIPALSGTAASAGAHTHSIPALSGSTNTAGSHTHDSWTPLNANTTLSHGMSALSTTGYAWIAAGGSGKKIWVVESNGAHSHTVTTVANTSGSNGAHAHNVTTVANTSGSSGGGTAFTNLQPYITVYMYKRIA